jgi:hypothetical protein
MTAPTFRIYERYPDGRIEDRQLDMSLDEFGGQCPVVGDLVVEAGVPSHLDRSDPANRKIWTVMARVFNPRDLPDYIALIVEERTPTATESEFVAG